MGHCVVPDAEQILDKSYPVLDKGFIRLVDYMGGDERIVQAARVSYGEGTKTVREDRGLIQYLLRNDHTSPFEQVVFTFHIKMPIFVARQWVRHRTERLNEISSRYSILKDEFYLPPAEDISFQSADNKQGRGTEPVPEEIQKQVRSALEADQRRVYGSYQELIGRNIARELARINLPLSIYTEVYWQMDLHNLFHFIRLRTDPHAQKEIRAYAEVLFDIVSKICPLASEAFEEHVLNSVTFSGKEKKALDSLLKGRKAELQGKDLERFNEKIKGL
ncbi:MAG: FAD-dependent thymidylate synthase [Spirochaetales bacterium]|nr:MAG: FAD-dependent thymidylate synthase [Spirochaetales bacterium]